MLDRRVVFAMAKRTFRQLVESPIAYVVGIFFYGFVGGLFSANYFMNNQASLSGITGVSPWLLWFVVPALTMGLLSEEFRLGTFEQLATLPVRDWEIVLGKFLGFAALAFLLVAGLAFYVVILLLTAQPVPGVDWGETFGVLLGLFLMCVSYGALGLFASSLTKNQVVSLILGMIFCTFIFMIGQVTGLLPAMFGRLADFLGILSHLDSVARGVLDLRDFAYFGSLIFLSLYFAVQRLSTRRF